MTTQAVTARELYVEDINPLIKIARDCLSEKKMNKSKFQRKNWLNKLESVYYSTGGDYPDEESADNASLYVSSLLEGIRNIIIQLSYCDLQKCIKDLEDFKTNKIDDFNNIH